MIQAFNTLVKPAYDKLNDTLGIKHIEVKQESVELPITIQFGYRENGEFIMESCNHAGAEVIEAVDLVWDHDAHTYAPTGSCETLACDKCNALQNRLGDWE